MRPLGAEEEALDSADIVDILVPVEELRATEDTDIGDAVDTTRDSGPLGDAEAMELVWVLDGSLLEIAS